MKVGMSAGPEQTMGNQLMFRILKLGKGAELKLSMGTGPKLSMGSP